MHDPQKPSKPILYIISRKMEPTYTPQQMAQMLNEYQRIKASHRNSQQQYYARNAEGRKAYASAYYQANKERILQRLAGKRKPVPAE
jgi:hypothetical protein